MNILPDFLSPKLVGKRFESHSIPLELLGDIAVLEAMLIDVAKWQYLRDNVNRKRVPRNFTDGISLKLTGVEEGSAIAKIALTLAVSGLFPTSQQNYLTQARDAIVSAIAAAGENQSPTTHLPPKALAYFDRLGRSLREGEAIEFPTTDHAAPARLNKETRLRLLKAAEVTERTEEIKIRGSIHEADQAEMTFQIMLPSGTKIPGPISEQHYDTILEAFGTYRQGYRVLLEGVGTFDRAEHLKRIETVEHITLLDPLDFSSQLEDLKALKDGWYDGKGIAPPISRLDWLAGMFNDCYADNLPLPYVYPVAEGGVRLEWSLGPNDVSLEVDLSQFTGEWHSLDLTTDNEDARPLKLNTREDWSWMVEKLQEIAGTAS